jgi:urea carboxylase
MFSKILIANRGAIACRIIRTLRAMNIQSVAVYAEADVDSLHVGMADEAWSLGDGPASQTYLHQDRIFQVLEQSGAQAVHPGYGFLSENPDFVHRCERAGVVFIGPSVASMEAFALKHQARALARRLDVPLIPGTDLLLDKAAALAAADSIGYPIILKSTAGGGGIGMQVCRSAPELDQAFDSVVRLSENNFSNGGVFIEKYISRARHIEVQVFGDGNGGAVALGERDCSLQRRNQKVIEETPAPGITESIRQQLHDTAIRLVAGVNYANAGTVEFIYDTDTDHFYFLEVNTRLQVEHGVTEEVFGVDLVRWMVEQAYAPIGDLAQRRERLTPTGHAIQARIYAENPARDFQPSAGLLSEVQWPPAPPAPVRLRIDTWVESGVEVSSYFDPMLAKVIVHAGNREDAIAALEASLAQSRLYGVETNLAYNQALLADPVFQGSRMYTGYLATVVFQAQSLEVIAPGTQTTIQDLHGRKGYWEVGVPPSGPYDSLSFRLGNQLLNNDENCAGLEITLNGPVLRFHAPARVAVTGAETSVQLDDQPVPMWTVLDITPGQVLSIGSMKGAGARAYLLLQGGLQCPEYLGSRATFTLGQFGGHVGRALRTGDVLHYDPVFAGPESALQVGAGLPPSARPEFTNHWSINVVYGPHGAPDFFTAEDIATFFDAEWEVHFNSSRTGIRLIGPKPEWARETGGEAGMHPSNIHDNAYAFGTIDFTGDMPVILGPDGPSLGGFVCPATVIHADLWKLGQLKAGDRIRFRAVTIDAAIEADKEVLKGRVPATLAGVATESCILERFTLQDGIEIVIRPAGDRFVLVEFGVQELNLELRFRVAALQQFLLDQKAQHQHLAAAISDLTPGIRSLQIHFDPHLLGHRQLLELIESGCNKMATLDDVRVSSRVVHLPLSWDDSACHEAVQKYMQSVRADAPWCPDNIEFIRRINGLASVDEVRNILFNADYVVMGLGDVYLGAPVATPLDPRQRLVTTKYNPARTWTAENSVGIGGAYLCIYGMEGPGGYQFVGRTLQMWNRYRSTPEFEQPWLLRFFDRIRFYPVSHDELEQIRRKFPRGGYPLEIEEGEFSLNDYREFLQANEDEIQAFTTRRQRAFDEELQRWRDSGQFHFDSSQQASADEEADVIPEGVIAIESSAAGNIWKLCVEEGQRVEVGQELLILESMKMEIAVSSHSSGIVRKILRPSGAQVSSGQALIYLELSEQ